jgi:2-oxoglutarate ferredoxin oxidoreductase subunit delta
MITAERKSTWRSEKTGCSITIDNVFCKGCTICEEICPTKVLKMIDSPDRWEGALAIVVDIDACTGCMLCEVQCPDFAIFVTKPEKVKKEKAEAV